MSALTLLRILIFSISAGLATVATSSSNLVVSSIASGVAVTLTLLTLSSALDGCAASIKEKL